MASTSRFFSPGTFHASFWGHCTLPDADRVRAALAPHTADGRLAVLVFMQPGADLDSAARAVMSKLMRELTPRCAAFSVVTREQGYWTTMKRLLAGGGRLTYPFGLHAQVEQGAAWLRAQAPELVPDDLLAKMCEPEHSVPQPIDFGTPSA